jgi:hypothetical protein
MEADKGVKFGDTQCILLTSNKRYPTYHLTDWKKTGTRSGATEITADKKLSLQKWLCLLRPDSHFDDLGLVGIKTT